MKSSPRPSPEQLKKSLEARLLAWADAPCADPDRSPIRALCARADAGWGYWVRALRSPDLPFLPTPMAREPWLLPLLTEVLAHEIAHDPAQAGPYTALVLADPAHGAGRALDALLRAFRTTPEAMRMQLTPAALAVAVDSGRLCPLMQAAAIPDTPERLQALSKHTAELSARLLREAEDAPQRAELSELAHDAAQAAAELSEAAFYTLTGDTAPLFDGVYPSRGLRKLLLYLELRDEVDGHVFPISPHESADDLRRVALGPRRLAYYDSYPEIEPLLNDCLRRSREQMPRLRRGDDHALAPVVSMMMRCTGTPEPSAPELLPLPPMPEDAALIGRLKEQRVRFTQMRYHALQTGAGPHAPLPDDMPRFYASVRRACDRMLERADGIAHRPVSVPAASGEARICASQEEPAGAVMLRRNAAAQYRALAEAVRAAALGQRDRFERLRQSGLSEILLYHRTCEMLDASEDGRLPRALGVPAREWRAMLAEKGLTPYANGDRTALTALLRAACEALGRPFDISGGAEALTVRGVVDWMSGTHPGAALERIERTDAETEQPFRMPDAAYGRCDLECRHAEEGFFRWMDSVVPPPAVSDYGPYVPRGVTDFYRENVLPRPGCPHGLLARQISEALRAVTFDPAALREQKLLERICLLQVLQAEQRQREDPHGARTAHGRGRVFSDRTGFVGTCEAVLAVGGLDSAIEEMYLRVSLRRKPDLYAGLTRARLTQLCYHAGDIVEMLLGRQYEEPVPGALPPAPMQRAVVGEQSEDVPRYYGEYLGRLYDPDDPLEGLDGCWKRRTFEDAALRAERLYERLEDEWLRPCAERGADAGVSGQMCLLAGACLTFAETARRVGAELAENVRRAGYRPGMRVFVPLMRGRLFDRIVLIEMIRAERAAEGIGPGRGRYETCLNTRGPDAALDELYGRGGFDGWSVMLCSDPFSLMNMLCMDDLLDTLRRYLYPGRFYASLPPRRATPLDPTAADRDGTDARTTDGR